MRKFLLYFSLISFMVGILGCEDHQDEGINKQEQQEEASRELKMYHTPPEHGGNAGTGNK